MQLWQEIEACMQMLDTALREAKQRGEAMVDAEAAYYSEKDRESFRMLEAGHANTYIQSVIKGRPSVAEAMSEYHKAEVEYKNAQEAIQVYKLKAKLLEAQYEREWGQPYRM